MEYLALFVPVASEGAAEAIARAVWPDDPGAQLTISLIDADGGAWLGANAAVTGAEIVALQGLAAVGGARYYRYAVDGDRPLAEASPPGPPTGTPWSWRQSLQAAGLARPDPEEPNS